MPTAENHVIDGAKCLVNGEVTYLSRCTPINPLLHCSMCLRRDKRLPPLLIHDARRCWGEGPSYYFPGTDIQLPEE